MSMKATGTAMSTIRKIAAAADKVFFWFVKGVSLLCFFLLFLLVFANVMIRINPIPELKISLHSFDELREWIQVAMIFYGAAGLWMLRDHFKLDMLNNALFTKNRTVHACFNLFIELASFFFIFVFTYASQYQVLTLFGETNDLRIPEKYIYLSGLLIPGIVMCIYAIRNIVVCLIDVFRKGAPAPDGGEIQNGRAE
jgi:TRAP-type C4-dicarboxylate transport system permease small subunit